MMQKSTTFTTIFRVKKCYFHFDFACKKVSLSLRDAKINSYLLYEFCKTPFCRTRFLEHEERSDECYKAKKYDKMAYKTSIIQYFFYFAP
jgi:hypothetical protein